MKTLLKGLGLILLFGILYVVIMVFAYDYLYPYPRGILDESERAAGALNYRIIHSTHVDKDTLLYFSRSNNGVGAKCHVGTYESDKPDLIANFFCEETSSVYFPVNAYGYAKATDPDNTCYLFGTTSDENTVAVSILFYKYAQDEWQEYEMIYDNHAFYYIGFDDSLAECESRIYGYNEDGGITFEWAGQSLSDGGYIQKDQES
ncbi:MAG: hypothetical protein IJJ19_04540 [Erysipelotrichaceae bacterium]|nr:hypothetical protein [Erysipelotrichaceae bacterium]MBR0474251.1 hypothetical protein [Erysipelotrichaceae bacterium]